MGGPGSGSWYRLGTKDTVEGYRRIDVRELHSGGWLHPGMSGTSRWSRNGEEVASIGWTVWGEAGKAYAVELYYTMTPAGGEPEQVRYKVPVTWTPCNYGGERPWFLCPGVVNGKPCGRRIAVLYGGRYFVCRYCYGLTYESQKESWGDRRRSKAQKIRRRLGGSANLMEHFPDKPKGMHWLTYWRLRRQAEEAEYDSLIAIAERLKLWTGRDVLADSPST